jgi:cell division septum initiation protein DivIVA
MSHPLSGDEYEQHDSAPIVPMEDRAPGFDIVLRGYDRDQVDRHVGWLEGLLTQAEESTSAAEQAANDARADAMAARQEAVAAKAELERGKPSFDALGERIARMLALAEEEAEAMRVQARRDVQQITSDARALEARVQGQRDDVVGKAERDAYEIVAAARAQAEQIVAEAKRRAEAMTADAQRQLQGLSAQRDDIRGELTRLHQQLASLARGQQ